MIGIRRIKPMLAGEDGRFLGQRGWYLQEKYDGTRCILFKLKNGKIVMMGRSWKNDFAPRFPEIVKEAKRLRCKTCILDGELTFFKHGRDEFVTALATEEIKKQYTVKLMVFDILSIDGKNIENKPIEERMKILKKVIPSSLKHIEIVKTYKQEKRFKQLFKKITKPPRQGEGVVLKEKHSPYVEDSRAYWVKVKKEKTADCVIVGITEGRGWRKPYFGALILAQYDDDGKLHFVGKCSGFDTETLKRFYKQFQKMKPPSKKPIEANIPNVKKWLPPKIVVEIKYIERTPYGIFRFPVFLRERKDKRPQECKINF